MLAASAPLYNANVAEPFEHVSRKSCLSKCQAKGLPETEFAVTAKWQDFKVCDSHPRGRIDEDHICKRVDLITRVQQQRDKYNCHHYPTKHQLARDRTIETHILNTLVSLTGLECQAVKHIVRTETPAGDGWER